MMIGELVSQCGMSPAPDIVTKLSVLLSSPPAFDELIAANQNLQIACRGLLSSAKDAPFLVPFAPLPAFSVDHALALGSLYRTL